MSARGVRSVGLTAVLSVQVIRAVKLDSKDIEALLYAVQTAEVNAELQLRLARAMLESSMSRFPTKVVTDSLCTLVQSSKLGV